GCRFDLSQLGGHGHRHGGAPEHPSYVGRDDAACFSDPLRLLVVVLRALHRIGPRRMDTALARPEPASTAIPGPSIGYAYLDWRLVLHLYGFCTPDILQMDSSAVRTPRR